MDSGQPQAERPMGPEEGFHGALWSGSSLAPDDFWATAHRPGFGQWRQGPRRGGNRHEGPARCLK